MLSRFELVLATCLFLIGMITVTEESGYSPMFYSHLAVVVFLFIGFLILNFISIPELIQRKFVLRNLAIVAVAIVSPAAAMGQVEFLVIPPFFLLVYTVIRNSALYIWRHGDAIQEKYRYITPGVILAVVLWSVSLFFLIIGSRFTNNRRLGYANSCRHRPLLLLLLHTNTGIPQTGQAFSSLCPESSPRFADLHYPDWCVRICHHARGRDAVRHWPDQFLLPVACHRSLFMGPVQAV